jgi:hypothetical protein
MKASRKLSLILSPILAGLLLVGCRDSDPETDAWFELSIVRVSSIPGAPEGRSDYTLGTGLRGAFLRAPFATAVGGKAIGAREFFVTDYTYDQVPLDDQRSGETRSFFATIGISFPKGSEETLTFFAQSIYPVLLESISHEVAVMGNDGSIVTTDNVPLRLTNGVIYTVVEPPKKTPPGDASKDLED